MRERFRGRPGALESSQKAPVTTESEGALVDPSTLIQRDMFGQTELMSLLSHPTRQHKIKLNINYKKAPCFDENL